MRHFSLYDTSEGVSYDRFMHLFDALGTVSPARHFTTMTYTYEDRTVTYRPGVDPTWEQAQPDRLPLRTITCPQRAGVRVREFAPQTPVPAPAVCTLQAPVTAVTLRECWEFAHDGATYTLTKWSRGTSKHDATRHDPQFRVDLRSDNPEHVRDLFGRFERGKEIPLDMESSTTPIEHALDASCRHIYTCTR